MVLMQVASLAWGWKEDMVRYGDSEVGRGEEGMGRANGQQRAEYL